MKFWISIPFYLWKNTFSRWIEYPVSPVSKILVPFLLALLAAAVLVFFAKVEAELKARLSDKSIYTVTASEFVGADNASTLLRKSYEEEVMWGQRIGHENFKAVRQPTLSALINRVQSVPLLSYSSSLTDFPADQTSDHPPILRLLTPDRSYHRQSVEIIIGDRSAIAIGEPMPAWIEKEMMLPMVVMAPVEVIEPYLQRGFIYHTVARFDTIPQVESYVNEARAYYRAEHRQVRISSALELLKNLEQIQLMQKFARSMVVTGCCVILALTLGSVSWLEYRQESYLLALLRSFGTPVWLLFLHMLLENLLLVMAGIAIAFIAWRPLFVSLVPKMQSLGMASMNPASLPVADFAVIISAGIIGVCISMLPVAYGLRKPTGLILQ